MQFDAQFTQMLYLALIRDLFDRCVKGELGLEIGAYGDNPENAAAVRIYMKNIILDAFINAIQEMKVGSQAVWDFSHLIADIADEATAELEAGSVPYEYHN